VEKVLEPIRQELAKDDVFTLNTAKQVSARLKTDRNSTLLELAESELEVSAENVPPLSGDLTSKQVDAVDSLMRNSYGTDWFKNRKTFSTSIDTNNELMASICTVFYLTSKAMLDLVEKEMSALFPGSTVVDGPMEEFLNSAPLVRAEAWKHASAYYTKARARLQRNIRAKRHRQKVKSEKLFEGDDDNKGYSPGSQNKLSPKGQNDSSEAEDDDHLSKSSAEGSTKSKDFVSDQVLRDKLKLHPLKSVQQCLDDIVEVSKFLNSEANVLTKYDQLSSLFNDHSSKLELRVGTVCGDGDDVKICMCVEVLNVIHEILPETLWETSRLGIITKEFSVQGVVPSDPPSTLSTDIREGIEALLEKELQILDSLVRRWVPELSTTQKFLTKQESTSIQALSSELGEIYKELDRASSEGLLSRPDVSWILMSFCRFYVRLGLLLWATPRSSSLVRSGQLVNFIAGLQSSYDITCHVMISGWLSSPNLKKSTANLRNAKQTRRVEAPATQTKSGACIHCHSARADDKGKEMTLFKCACGKQFHHMCAGELGHESWRTCFDCEAVKK